MNRIPPYPRPRSSHHKISKRNELKRELATISNGSLSMEENWAGLHSAVDLNRPKKIKKKSVKRWFRFQSQIFKFEWNYSSLCLLWTSGLRTLLVRVLFSLRFFYINMNNPFEITTRFTFQISLCFGHFSLA